MKLFCDSEKYKIYNGSMLDMLEVIEQNSIDSIVCDPPYELGFMGKKWDSFGIAFQPKTWEKCLKVLKPGGYLLAFGGSRTFHRIAVAIEDAGFEIRDTIMWLYGCLSEDTEILTLNGWERYHKAIEESPVICYNMDKDSFEIHQPERSFIYENKHPAYRIKSDFTDQIVSRNHRCIVERGGRKVFAYAETLERQESVPFLESLHDLPETIPYPHEGTSITKQDLLQRVRLQEYQQKQEGESNPSGAMRGEGVDNLPCMWEGRLEVPKNVKEGGNTHLQQTVQRGFEGGGMEETRPQREGELDEGVGAKVSRAYDGGEQPSLEGRGDVLQKEGQLYGSEVCTMPRAVPTDVEERRLYYGTSADRGATLGENVEADRSSTSYRSRSDQQRSCESYVVSEQQCSQEVRSYGKTRTTLATVEEVEYVGNMWCVQVPTGAFVARRNGQIFITGNSGFPKSMDVSKAFDKRAGVEREVVGISTNGAGNTSSSLWVQELGSGIYDGKSKVFKITAPATSLAKKWDGWGTALKPAHEPIIVARKPFKTSVIENIIKYGVGGLNIDECRVVADDQEKLTKSREYFGKSDIHKKTNSGAKFLGSEKIIPNMTPGRFPANVIHDGSEEVISGFPETNSGKKIVRNYQINRVGLTEENPVFNTKTSGFKTNIKNDGISNYGDNGSASRYFYTAKVSKKDRDEGLEIAASTINDGRKKSIDNPYQRGETPRKNIHPTVKPCELMQYLIRLVTPKGGIILDPFMGSGSTGKACMFENRERDANYKFIGIDLEKEYCEIAEARIDYALNKYEYDYQQELKKAEEQGQLSFDLFGDVNAN